MASFLNAILARLAIFTFALTAILCAGSTWSIAAGIIIKESVASSLLPKYIAEVKTLSQDHSYFSKDHPTDYWNLSPYYLPQHNEKACSVATVAMALNALRANQNLTSSDELFTNESLMEKVHEFSEAVRKSGQGMNLEQLQKNTQKALNLFFPSRFEVEIYRFNIIPKEDELKRLREILQKNEKNSNDLLIANFLQLTFTGDPDGNVGHISPIAAYDSKTDRVLIMDVDRQYYEPYWVSSEKLLEAVNTIDPSTKKPRGLVWIRQK